MVIDYGHVAPGFGDTLLIRDEHRYDMYDLQIENPPALVPPPAAPLTVEDKLADRYGRRR